MNTAAHRLPSRPWLWIALATVALIGGGIGVTASATQAAKAGAGPKYIGTAKCKNCHDSKESGAQYSKWKEEKHTKAFETLASADAKKIAKEKGIDDPQKAAACLKCHATAGAEADDRIAKGFDRNAGVQCESCHGPGEKHQKARMAAAATAGDDDKAGAAPVEIPKDEMATPHPDQATCLGCHNKESPSYKPFCFKKRFAEVAHLDPRRKRAPDYAASLKCDCDDCKKEKGGQ